MLTIALVRLLIAERVVADLSAKERRAERVMLSSVPKLPVAAAWLIFLLRASWRRAVFWLFSTPVPRA